MHKGVILLMKAGDRKEAEAKAEEFLNSGYGDGRVWDWYVIGGRWTGLLTGYEPEKDPRNIETCSLCKGTGTRTDWLKSTSPEWVKECNGCNGCLGTGKSVKFSFVEVDDNIMPCTPEVVAKINEYSPDQAKKREADIAKDLEKWGKAGTSKA